MSRLQFGFLFTCILIHTAFCTNEPHVNNEEQMLRHLLRTSNEVNQEKANPPIKEKISQEEATPIVEPSVLQSSPDGRTSVEFMDNLLRMIDMQYSQSLNPNGETRDNSRLNLQKLSVTTDKITPKPLTVTTTPVSHVPEREEMTPHDNLIDNTRYPTSNINTRHYMKPLYLLRPLLNEASVEGLNEMAASNSGDRTKMDIENSNDHKTAADNSNDGLTRIFTSQLKRTQWLGVRERLLRDCMEDTLKLSHNMRLISMP